MSEASKVKTAFIVVVGADGGLSTLPLELDGLNGAVLERKATAYDIYHSAKEIASDIEQQLLAAKVVEAVQAVLQPASPNDEFAKRLQQRLVDRATSDKDES